MTRKKTTDNAPDRAIFPLRLRLLMQQEPKTSQETLGNAVGVTRQAVGHYIDGKSSPSWETLSAIADYFSVSTDYLLGRTDKETNDFGVAYIQEYTGLSYLAVERLHHISHYTQYSAAVELLNTLCLASIDGDIPAWEVAVDYIRKAAKALNTSFSGQYDAATIYPNDLAYLCQLASVRYVTAQVEKAIYDMITDEAARMKAEEPNE